MTLSLEENYRVVNADRLNFTVQIRTTIGKGKRAGEVVWQDLGHYPSLERAAQAVVDKHLAGVDATFDAKGIVEEIRKSSAMIADACRAGRWPAR